MYLAAFISCRLHICKFKKSILGCQCQWNKTCAIQSCFQMVGTVVTGTLFSGKMVGGELAWGDYDGGDFVSGGFFSAGNIAAGSLFRGEFVGGEYAGGTVAAGSFVAGSGPRTVLITSKFCTNRVLHTNCIIRIHFAWIL